MPEQPSYARQTDGAGQTRSSLSLGYIVIAATDLAAWRDYAIDILGLELAGEGEAGLAFRMDHYAQRILIVEGPEDDVVLAGWEVDDASALEALAGRLIALGYEVERADGQAALHRKVRGLIRFTDPDGFACEAFFGPYVLYDRPFRSPRRISGFQTEGQGLGHLTMTVGDLERSMRFYGEGLGFSVSDTIDISFGAGSFLGTFLHCNARHHTLALAAVPAPKRLHHMMIQTNTLDDVGLTLDVVQDAGVEITASIGRHTNDQMVSFYMRTPSGFELEYGWGAREVEADNWSVEHHTSMSIWGHRRS